MYLKAKMMRVKGKSDVPTGRHYSILVYKSEYVYIEGDERSRIFALKQERVDNVLCSKCRQSYL